MRLLVTRPEADAIRLKAELVARGHEVILEPLIEVVFEDDLELDLEGVQALIATSRNGLRALARMAALDAARTLPVFTVGPGTASLAKELRFETVVRGPGTARDLVPMLMAGAEVNGGPLLHLAGDVVAGDFAGGLQRIGFHVLQPVVYTTRSAERLAASTVAHLRNGRIDATLLFSPRTARVYAELVGVHNLSAAARRMRHLCLSAAVAVPLATMDLGATEIAAAPDLEQMLALLDGNAAHSGRGAA